MEKKEKKEMTKAPTGFEIIKREFIKDKIALVSLIILVALILIIFISSALLNQDEVMTVSLLDKYARPGEGFWLGADSGGRSDRKSVV